MRYVMQMCLQFERWQLLMAPITVVVSESSKLGEVSSVIILFVNFTDLQPIQSKY